MLSLDVRICAADYAAHGCICAGDYAAPGRIYASDYATPGRICASYYAAPGRICAADYAAPGRICAADYATPGRISAADYAAPGRICAADYAAPGRICAADYAAPGRVCQLEAVLHLCVSVKSFELNLYMSAYSSPAHAVSAICMYCICNMYSLQVLLGLLGRFEKGMFVSNVSIYVLNTETKRKIYFVVS